MNRPDLELRALNENASSHTTEKILVNFFSVRFRDEPEAGQQCTSRLLLNHI